MSKGIDNGGGMKRKIEKEKWNEKHRVNIKQLEKRVSE
jgi:hypothetical protein